MLVASLLEAYVVVAADAGQHRDLLAAQAGHASAAAGVGDADVLRPDELTPGAQVFADQVLVRHRHNDTPGGRVDPGPASTRKTESLVRVLRCGDTRMHDTEHRHRSRITATGRGLTAWPCARGARARLRRLRAASDACGS